MKPHFSLSLSLVVPGILILIGGLYALLGLFSWRYRDSLAARLFTWLMLALGLWSLSYGLEIYAKALLIKYFWARIEYIGIVSAPVLWFLFILVYTDQWSWMTRQKWMLLWVIPIFTLVLFWTNESHHLIWTSVTLTRHGPLTVLDPNYGWFFWVFTAFAYSCIVIGSVIAIVGALRLPALYRSQVLAIIAAALFPLIGNIVYLFLDSNLDLTPFFFFPSSIALAWAMARYRLLDIIIPPTPNAILQNLHDAVLLLDRQRRVLYMNAVAEAIFSQPRGASVGKPVQMVCGECSTKLISLLDRGEEKLELTMPAKEGPRQFEIRILPMTASAKSAQDAVSHLIIFHDVTENRKVERALKRRDGILRVVSLAAEQFLKSSEWEQSVPLVLEQLGIAAQASRVYIFERFVSPIGESLVSQRYEWVAEDIEPQIGNPMLQNLAWREAGFARWEDTLARGQFIAGRVRDFPLAEQELLTAQDILSIAIMPIFLDDKLWGFIGFDDCLHEREWSDSDLGALRAAADILGAALARRNVELSLYKRQHSQELLQEIIRSSLGQSTLTEMAQVLVDHLGSLIGADQCFLSVWNEKQETVVPLAAYGLPLEEYLSRRIQAGEKKLTESALSRGQMLIVHDAQDSSNESRGLVELFKTRSALVIPMISNEKKLGVVLLGFSNLHQFTPEEIILSEQAVELITLAFAKSQAVEEAQRRYDESETLRRAGATVAETLNLQEATSRLLEQLAFVVPHDSASVQLLRDGALEIIGGEGWTDISSIIGLRFPIPGDNPNTKVIETRQPLLINDTHQAYPAFRTLKHASHIRSWMGIPLIVHNQIIGLLAIDSRETNHFTQDDVQLASAFASQVAVAIENARLFDKVQQLAITDGLTGLYNRRHFMELAQSEFERARRYKRHLSAMMFDIDHFKIVNDTYGHPFGDTVLQAIATLCKDKLREADPIARYGGEEFIALIVEANASAAKKVGERLRIEVEKMPMHYLKKRVHITVSIGIATLTKGVSNLDDLIARADQALYIAKQKGRNRVVLKH